MPAPGSNAGVASRYLQLFNSVNPGRMRTAMRAAAYPAEDPNTVPAAESVIGPFLYLLSERGRGIDGQFIDAQ